MVEKKKQKFLQMFNENADISVREVEVNRQNILLFFIDCLINKELFTNGLMFFLEAFKKQQFEQEQLMEKLEKELLKLSSVKRIQTKQDIYKEIFNGSVIVTDKSSQEYLALNLAGFQNRAISEPPTASVVRGPREGFIEDLEINLSMLRRRLKTPSLAIKRKQIGKRTQTKIALVYLNDVLDPNIIKDVEAKLKKIDIDGVLDSYYIEELLCSPGDMFFKKIGNSEKPDVICSKILEGRLAIIVDGSPIVLTLPYILFEDMQSPSDYYDISFKSTIVRFIRLIGLMCGILLPGLYVALQSYHYRILPINFLITLLSSIEGISFPPVIEILFVLFLFDILNEASVRMPKQLGMALSIIGALILGDTAVQAGIITPPSIVVVAISGITLYIIPNQVSQASILRTAFTIVGGFSGLYGIFIGFITLASYLVSIETFGSAYMAPYAPSVASDKKDGFVKRPLNKMIYRPKSFKTLNSVRYQPQNKQVKVKNLNKSKLLKEREK